MILILVDNDYCYAVAFGNNYCLNCWLLSCYSNNLQCHSNNRADTDFAEFLAAVWRFGLPSCVMTNQEVKNEDNARYMLTHPERGLNRGSHITGRSMHNQRVERLWRDVYYACTLKYYWLFSYMEDIHILDPSSKIRLFCLHMVYIPLVNHHLRDFIA